MRTFENTTVGEIIDNPELNQMIQDNCPELLEHPLLEVGRTFTFEAALPYIEDMVTDEQLEMIREALAKLD